MRQSTILAALAGVLSCAVLTAHAGDVYKYTDERGNTMYTDKYMPGAVKVSGTVVRPPEVTQRNYNAQQASSNQQLAASNQRIAQGQSDSHAASQVAKDLEATRAARCKQARDNYDTTINSRRLYTTDKDGNRQYLSDSQLAAERLEARKQVDAICGPQG
jgi:tRNA A37 threonylcarbamoyladenosine modification protein TsaB